MSNSRCGQTTGHPASLSTASAAQPPAEASRPAAAWGHGTSAGMHAASQHSSDEQYTPRTLQQTESTLPFAALAANSSSKPSSNIVDIDDVNMQRQHAGRQHHKHSSHRSSSSQQAQYQDAFLGDAATTAKQPRTNEVSIDDIGIGNTGGHASRHPSAIARLQQGPSAAAAAVGGRSPFRPLHRPVGSEMLDFPSGDLDLVRHLNLDGIFLDKQESVTHDVGEAAEKQSHRQPQRPGMSQPLAEQQQQQPGSPEPLASSSTRHPSSRPSSSRKYKQGEDQPRQQDRLKQQQEATKPVQIKYSAPRPHPLYLKPKHVKTHFMIPTSDGWKLHMIRTQVLNTPPSHHHPVILCPGLGSSGAYSFDLSPAVSLADYMAGKGWDVWTCELRGNGMSDKPKLLSGRSRWWTIDDYVEKDVPAIIRFVLKETHAPQVHFLGHSMGGMILCGVMARVDTTTSKIRSCISVGSGLFLEESWWRLFDRFRFMLHAMWVVPSGTLLRNYSRLMFGPWAIPYIDMLYFWPSNVDPRVGRAMMTRNFSNISVGVLLQIATAFGPKGLLSSDKRMVYADPSRLSKVSAPALFLVGDRDRMCPPEGCRKTWQMFGSLQKRFVCLGPASGFADHYGHFDILMGKRVEMEVYPMIHNFLVQHDAPKPRL